MQKAERNAEKESIGKIEEYKRKEKHILRRIKSEIENEKDENSKPVNYDSYENELLRLIETLKGDLLDIEMALQQALESARSGFFTTIKGINDDMVAS